MEGNQIIKRHIYANEFLLNLEVKKRVTIFKRLLFLLLMVIHVIKDATYLLVRKFKTSNESGPIAQNFRGKSIWFFESFNNVKALKPIAKYFEHSIFISFSENRDYLNELEYVEILVDQVNLDHRQLLYKYKFLFLILFTNRYSNYYFRTILENFNRNEIAFTYLSNCYKPLFGITSNDINSFSRICLYSLKLRGVSRFYVQHASVSSIFPKLDFTIAFLYGKVSASMYRVDYEDVPANVQLIGNHLFDSESNAVKGKPNNIINGELNIGLAYNTMDDLEVISQVIHRINSESSFSAMIFVKPHPRDMRSRPKGNYTLVTELYDFLNAIDVLATGISGIALDASLYNITVYQINWQKGVNYCSSKDYYGFKANKIIKECNEDDFINELISIYKGEKILGSTRSKCKMYDESIDKDWEFEVSAKIALEIIKILKDKNK